MTSKYAIYTQQEILNILLCIVQTDILHFLNPNTALKK